MVDKMNIKMKINYDCDELYCIYSKERIQIGEKYVIIEEEYDGEIIEKTYKTEYAPAENEDEDFLLD